MKFVTLVRKEKLKGPLRREFDAKQWSAEFTSIGEDNHDQGLHEAGLLIHQKATDLRARVRFAYSTEHAPTTKLRALVAMSNHFALDTERRAHEKLAQIDGQYTQFDVLTLKLQLPVGAQFSPDEILQGIADGCQIPIRETLTKADLLESQPKFATVNWDDVWGDVNLGVLYGHLESLWDDCLWNGYSPRDQGAGSTIRFTVNDPEWSRRFTASQLRRASLSMGFLMMAHNLNASGKLPDLGRLAGVRRVKEIRKEGRKQVIVFVPVHVEDGSNDEAAIVRLYASETFYRDLLDEKQSRLGGATLDHLLSAWMVVTQVGKVMREPLHLVEPGKRPTHAWLPAFAPLLQRNALITALTKELPVDLAATTALVEFLTYRGRATQEIWAQPLVPVSDAAVTPVFAALGAEPSRLLDVWLRQLGVDLGRRGPAFEHHVRSELLQLISASALKPIAAVLERPFAFKPGVIRAEEMDLVLRVGDVIVVGEVKCVLIPTEAKQRATHRNVLVGAASQVERKVAAAIAHPDTFRQQLLDQGMVIPDNFRLIPVVVSNSAIHVGFPINGVPVVDLHILEVYFTGSFTDTVMTLKEPDQHVRTHRIYTEPAEAPQVLESYLQAPPQMATYVNGLRERWVPVGKLSATDREWSCLEFEAVPDVSAALRAAEDNLS